MRIFPREPERVRICEKVSEGVTRCQGLSAGVSHERNKGIVSLSDGDVFVGDLPHAQ